MFRELMVHENAENHPIVQEFKFWFSQLTSQMQCIQTRGDGILDPDPGIPGREAIPFLSLLILGIPGRKTNFD